MRDRRHIGDRGNPHTRSLDSPDGDFATGSRTFDEYLHFLETQCLGIFHRLFSSHTGRKRRALARALEARLPCAGAGHRIALCIRHSDDGIIEGSQDMHLSRRQRLALAFACAFSASPVVAV